MTSEQTWPLRHKVLRPHQTIADCHYPRDESAIHFGAFEDETIVGIASVYHEAEPGLTQPGAWRLRGMATDPAVRGKGHGGALLLRVIDTVRGEEGTMIWANARVGVRGFYERYGFVVVSAPYDVPGLGEHVLIHLAIRSASHI